MNTPFRPNISVYDNDDYANLVELKFLDNGNSFYEWLTAKASLSPYDVFQLLNKWFTEPAFNFVNDSFYITDDTNIYIRVNHDSIDEDDTRGKNGKYSVSIWGKDRSVVLDIKRALKQLFESNKTFSVV